ncbi:adenosylmethionine decarboxylase [Neisseria bacilliformis]|uniref:S-adenosylmethionine decarboxylase proenzyme n=1 Tax=Neisseria bacilliformis ATCC BAA-1200 TaxID=888742 RepID=F2BC16_9NEIS|nr:adenosylmethionine decarboxylase [Neisseria bacilliformis]EGF11076.1 S-adenosylmethionine decarboxylase proenzyme [Neisseria bacilliformis ATCC BAA-1200]QMT48312.1 adenosylmethionine decarboxylase [Neisseria bacilliformis]
MTSPGRHGLLDLYGCDENILRDAARLQTILEQAAAAARATVLYRRFHTFGGAGGVTGVLLLAESHISIHTWPEHRYAAADIFLCGHMPAQAARRTIEHGLCARNTRWQSLMRGEAV